PLRQSALVRLNGCELLWMLGHVAREGIRELGRQGLTTLDALGGEAKRGGLETGISRRHAAIIADQGQTRHPGPARRSWRSGHLSWRSTRLARCARVRGQHAGAHRAPAYPIRGSDSSVTRRPGSAIVPAMLALVAAIIGAFFAAFPPRRNLVAANLALRQQLAALVRGRPRPRLGPIDRAFWVVLARTWSRWADALAIVKPATVIAWHRRRFARFWAWKSRRIGRPPLSPEVVALIVQMARENPLWSRRRIANELAKLGHDVGKDAVARYMPRPAERPPPPPSQTWGTFIRTHAVGTIAIDFFTLPTVTFGVLYAFFVLSLERRRVIHVNVTEHPTAELAAQQIIEAGRP